LREISIRRHDQRLALEHRWTGAKAVVGVVGAAVAIGLTGCSSGSNNPSATPTATTSPTTTAPVKSGHPHEITGKVTAENGSTWMITADNGMQYTVDITPQTEFGTKQTPSTTAQFPVGSTVRVSGTANGNTITATRITAPGPHYPTSAPFTPPS
jgi:uncharacterized protein DUF5666